MFDVVPPGSSGKVLRREPEGGQAAPRRARPIRPRVSSRTPSSAQEVRMGPRTVQVEWKLPARLRKPVREQLRRERAKRRHQKQIMSFDRRPITTRPLLVHDRREEGGAKVREPRSRVFNHGAEYHTGDTYTQGRPQLQVAPPPYAGFAARRASGAGSRSSRPTDRSQNSGALRRKASAPSRKTSQVARMDVRNRSAVQPPLPARSNVKAHAKFPMSGERDVPVDWGGDRGLTKTSAEPLSEELFVQVERPKRRVASGLTFSLWPGNWFKGSNATGSEGTARQHVKSANSQKELAKKKLNY